MASFKRAPMSKTQQYTRTYKSMRGVYLSPSEKMLESRYTYIENMYRDYESGDGDLPESIPGFRRIHKGDERINGLFVQRTKDGVYVVIHHGRKLLRFKRGEESAVALTGIPFVNDAPSLAFEYGEGFYFSDGQRIYTISEGGEVRPLLDSGDPSPYIPTLYKNGLAYEERNVLTQGFKEQTQLIRLADYTYATPSLRFNVTSLEARECAVSGISNSAKDVHIPGRVMLGGEYYTVTEIESSAFSGNTDIVSVTLADSVRRIGNRAFYACTALKQLVAGDGLVEMGDAACFASGLCELYLPAGFTRFGISAIPSGVSISYELGSAEYANIANSPVATLEYGVRRRDVTIGIKLMTPCSELSSVSIDGIEAEYIALTDERGYITEVKLLLGDKSAVTGATLTIIGRMPDDIETTSNITTDLSVVAKRYGFSLPGIITACTRSASVDGRVFLFGHPSLPSTVFYSKRTDEYGSNLYFGTLDYFNVGDGIRVSSVLGLPDSVAIFTERDSGEGYVHLHTPKDYDGLRERFYPLSEMHPYDEALGKSVSFGDEAVFLSGSGLVGIEQLSPYQARTLVGRSESINSALLREDVSAASLAVWRGYLVISVGGRMYLADSRATYNGETGKQYEWFILNGIGTYRGDSRVYRYASLAPEGYALSDTPDGVALGTVYSEDTGNGLVYFIPSGEQKIAVYPTEEFTGGEFYPAERILSLDGLLFFTTACGDVCVFNSDMRGKAPARIAEADDFDPDEYAARYGRRIHSDYYDFAGHAPRYALVTAWDDCGLPHMAKSTVSSSLAIKLKCFIDSSVSCRIGCDGDGYSSVGKCDGGITDMSDVSFEDLPFASSERTTVFFGDRSRAWIEKSISVLSDSFRSPIGIYSISYRYRVSGRPRKL